MPVSPPRPVPIHLAFPRGSRAGIVMSGALEPYANRLTLSFADDPDAPARLAAAEIVVAPRLEDEELDRAPALRWLASVAAGLEEVATPAVLARGIAVTGASGVHGPNIAEHVLALMLMFARGMPLYVHQQAAGQWRRGVQDRDDDVFAELSGATLLVVGLGQIGQAVARRAKAFEMEVVGVRRSGGEPPPGVDRVVTQDSLDEVLGHADHVCLALPLTPATHHLFDAARLARMKRSARLYNIGRGGLVDQPALVDALRSGRIAGAGLDVFDPEPLPPGDPLWQLDNVIVTPHVSGVTPRYYERFAPILTRNVERWLGGRPLENRYDPGRGY